MDTDDKRKTRGRKRWTEDEDAILYEEAMKQSSTGNVRDWHRIATKLPGRTNKDCRKRWVNKVCGGLKKGLWDPEEDRRLQAAVEKHGLRWPLIAGEVGFRSPDQCAKRWQYGLDPRLKHREWTAEEDKLLLTLVQERGREWKAIQHNHYPTRSRIDLKNRYTILMRRMGNTPVEPDGESNSSDSSGSDSEECGTPGPSSTRRASSNSTTDGSRSPQHRRSQAGHPRRHSRLHSTASASSEPSSYVARNLHQPDWMTTTATGPAARGGPTVSLAPNASSVSLTALDMSVSSPTSLYHDSTAAAAAAAAAIDATTEASLNMDFFDNAAAAAAAAAASGGMAPTAWDESLADMSFPTPTVSSSLASFLPPGAFASTGAGYDGASGDPGKMPATSAASMELDMSMDMDMVFDPELLNMSGEALAHNPGGSSSSGVASVAGAGSSAGDGSRGTDGTEGLEKDLSKVVIAVDGCDKDTLDYLFNVTRPIKGRVKMEITM